MVGIEDILNAPLPELARLLRELADEMVCNEPEDMARMRARKTDVGREFAVWEYTVGYCMNFSDQLSLLRAQADAAERGEEPGDLATLARATERLCDWYAGSFDVTGKMDDAVAIIGRCGRCFPTARSLAEFRDLCRGLERYLVQLLFWVDRQIPWSAVSDLVHGYRMRTVDAPAR